MFAVYLCVCMCVCVCVCNIHLIFFICYYFSAPDFLRLPIYLSLLSSQLYSDSEIYLDIRQNPLLPSSAFLPSTRPVRPVLPPKIYPRQGASSGITAPSVISGRFQMRAPFSRGTWRSRLLDLTIASDIRARTKPHISEYSRFSL